MRDQDNGKPARPVSQLSMDHESQTALPLAKTRPETGDASSKAASKWNTKNLFLRLASDFASAAAAASMVAPLISIIDRCAEH